jgi:hypothetical protein
MGAAVFIEIVAGVERDFSPQLVRIYENGLRKHNCTLVPQAPAALGISGVW